MQSIKKLLRQLNLVNLQTNADINKIETHNPGFWCINCWFAHVGIIGYSSIEGALLLVNAANLMHLKMSARPVVVSKQ